jgi:hypothetical protein
MSQTCHVNRPQSIDFFFTLPIISREQEALPTQIHYEAVASSVVP